MYKMIVMDLDGTLLNSSKAISDKTKFEIARLKKNSVHVTIATGRSLHNSLSFIDELEIDIPIICADGATIYDPLTKKVIRDLHIPDDKLHSLFQGAALHLDSILVGTENLNMAYSKEISSLPEEDFKKGDFGNFLTNTKYSRVPFFDTDEIGKIQTIVLHGEHENLELAVAPFEFDPELQIRKYVWGKSYLINRAGVSKLCGVKFLCEHLNCSLDSVVAFGDEGNDIEMIKHSGLGIAMANAADSVKSVAKFTTLSNDDDGVAYALKKYFV